MNIAVYATPALLPEDVRETAVVVIDALRMTTTAAAALQSGCTGLMAMAEVEEARALARASGALLGGERSGLRLEGFDLDNSPLAYTPARVSGRRLVMTTTNGTRAILAASGAKRVLLGAFVNASAIARALRAEARVALLCAGTAGAFTLEDALAAGAMIERLGGDSAALDDMAIAVHRLYAQAKDDLHGALAQTTHYRRLQALQMQNDLAYCLGEDRLDAVPEKRADGWFTRA